MPKPKAGTGPKPGISPPERYDSGRKKEEHVEGIAPTLLKRLKDEVIPRAKDKRLGTVLGLMHLQGILTETETEAGFLYAEDVGKYERVMGHPRRTARSPSFDNGYGGGGLDLELLWKIDPERAQKIEDRIKREKRKAEKNYQRAQKFIPQFPAMVRALIEDVCCNDRPVSSLNHAGIKAILGNLARECYRLQGGDEREKPNKPKKADAIHMAEAACDAVAARFERDKGTIHAFDIGAGVHKRRRLICYGAQADGTSPMQYAVEVELRGLLPAVLDAQLLKSALKREWAEVSQTRRSA